MTVAWIFAAIFAITTFDISKEGLRVHSANPSVVQVGRHCSGFVAKKGWVFTAGHCVQGPAPIVVHFVGGESRTFQPRSYPAESCWTHHCDVAILQGDTSPGRVAKLQPNNGIMAQVQDGCIHMGHPRRAHQQWGGFCKIISFGQRNWYFAGNIFPGDSGSPLYNFQKEVIGIIHSSIRKPPIPWAAASDIDWAIGLLKDLERAEP